MIFKDEQLFFSQGEGHRPDQGRVPPRQGHHPVPDVRQGQGGGVRVSQDLGRRDAAASREAKCDRAGEAGQEAAQVQEDLRRSNRPWILSFPSMSCATFSLKFSPSDYLRGCETDF